MRKQLTLALAAAAAVGCGSNIDRPLTSGHADALRDSVEAFLAAIPPALTSDGPIAWLAFFENTAAFYMASDGQVVFPTWEAAETFLEDFAARVSGMELVWDSVRVEPLAPSLAAVAAAYRESITDTAGTTIDFSGYVTGVARRRSGEWKLQSLHWSSPVSSAP